jgi:apolipoprotein N-acyltransferase
VLVPWLLWLDAPVRPGRAFVASVALTFVFTFGVFGWFARGIADYAAAPAWHGWFALALLAPVLQPQIAVWSVTRSALRLRGLHGAWLALAGACVYVAAEWIAPKLFADTLGHGLLPFRHLRQAADLAGAPGLTFAIVLGNEAAAASLRAAWRHDVRGAAAPALASLGIVAALFGYGAWRLHALESRDARPAPLRAGLIQADISHYARMRAELGTHDAARSILDAHFALSADALARGPLDLLVWPETVYPTTFGAPKSAAGAAFDREIAAFALATGVPLVFGAYDTEGADEYNAAMFLLPGAGSRVEFEAYRKALLFPLTERVPALFDSQHLRAALPWLGSWKPGPGARVIDLPLADGRTIRVAPLICYDAVSPRLARDAVRGGAELLVTLSNDSWFAAGGGPRLHLAVAAFRSIETRRPQLRATNTGISAAIDASGERIAVAGVHERAALVASVVPERAARTLVLAWGDWLGPAALAAVIGVVLLAPRGAVA